MGRKSAISEGDALIDVVGLERARAGHRLREPIG